MLQPRKSNRSTLKPILATAFVAKSSCDVLSAMGVDKKEVDKLEDFFEDVIDHLITQESIAPPETTELSLMSEIVDLVDLQEAKGMIVDLVKAESIGARNSQNITLAVILEKVLLLSVIPEKKK